MRALICGWYGTETIGDRAILAGIIKVLGKVFTEGSVDIGSLYPFLTKRTIMEDYSFYKSISPNIKVGYFDMNDLNTIDRTIQSSDVIIFGGGPIMDLIELEKMRYTFIRAKEMNKKTMIFGCGLGPLYKKQFIKVTNDILQSSDIIVFRDRNSVQYAKKIYNGKPKEFLYAPDPAILVSEYFIGDSEGKENKSIALNLRDFRNIGFKGQDYVGNDLLVSIIDILSESFDEIKLVPMHTFGIGGDDRLFLSKIADKSRATNVNVIQKPQSLEELLKTFASSSACVGMRYHSVVFQTLLNGNNYVLDYTEKDTGKISSFLKDVDYDGFYDNRYINVINKFDYKIIYDIPKILCENKKFDYKKTIFSDTTEYYCDLIKAMLKV